MVWEGFNLVGNCFYALEWCFSYNTLREFAVTDLFQILCIPALSSLKREITVSQQSDAVAWSFETIPVTIAFTRLDLHCIVWSWRQQRQRSENYYCKSSIQMEADRKLKSGARSRSVAWPGFLKWMWARGTRLENFLSLLPILKLTGHLKFHFHVKMSVWIADWSQWWGGYLFEPP